jgi:hypothetical protein
MLRKSAAVLAIITCFVNVNASRGRLPLRPQSRSASGCGGWRGQKRSPTVRAMGLRTGVNYVI